QAKLADVTLRLTVGLGRWRHPRSGASGAPLRHQVGSDVTAFRPDRFATLLVDETELHGIVAVALADAFRAGSFLALLLDLQDWAGAHLQDRHGRDLPVFLVDLGHAHFAAK